jgi:3-phosphoshikimate 1-carboxyvinyltransferase
MFVSYSPKPFVKSINVPGSKSITNRLYVLKHLYFPNMEIGNASTSSDSVALTDEIKKIESGQTNFHVEDGGTTLRFLLCIVALHNKACTITCGKRLLNRPHDGLLHTLNEIGFDVQIKNERFVIQPVALTSIINEWSVDVSTSSQYASALLLIAASMKSDVIINLSGTPVSLGYLKLTVGVMQDMGMDITWQSDSSIKIKSYQTNDKSIVATVESDWSSVSYFVLLARLTNNTLKINNVNLDSLQPDQNILEFGTLIGVDYHLVGTELTLTPNTSFLIPSSLNRNYTNCPDIALTEIVGCKALRISLKTLGIAHLKHKESNREKVIKEELLKLNQAIPEFETHHDHRIAMSLTPLCTIKPIQMDNINVVSKSFPDFWHEVSKLGINLTRSNV